jgi:hypothetical protein
MVIETIARLPMFAIRSLVAILTLTGLLGGYAMPPSNSTPTQVRLQVGAEHSRLLVNGQPFFIKGAGLEFGDPQTLAARGANAMRTWRTDNGQHSGREVLDRAWASGLYVAMGLEIARERHGFNYDNPLDVQRQFDAVKAQVLQLKDHPALIIWLVGNELNLDSRNPRVWNAVNDISRMIHAVDTNHLTMTTLAGIGKDVVDNINARAPDLDLIGIQMYGAIGDLQQHLQVAGWRRPYVVTEWGATGHWEVPKTQWGAPIENDSSTKAELYRSRYEAAIRADSAQCLGSFVFLWGQKQERTPTWYGMFLDTGEKTATVDAMQALWTGQSPRHPSPRMQGAWLDGQTARQNIQLHPGQATSARMDAFGYSGQPLRYHWEIAEESRDLKTGGDRETRPPAIAGLITHTNQAEITLSAPTRPGAYRLFGYAYDGEGAAAHVNLPFYVLDK